MSKYNTTYFEIYAALVLSKIGFLPIDFNIEWIQDKPDIQVGSIGVEVTSDAPKEHRSDLSIVNEIFGHDFSPEEKAEHLKKLDKRRMISDRFSEDMNSIEFKIYENSDILSEAIKGKDEKLYSYKKFYNNALFIFSSVYMLDTNNTKVTTA
ncbi:MAG: hypothetical protein LBM69_09155 [Lachnospiraceae bacterium]|jgi:hypothetical protein|nr:hypothetical protein [Lachnospiraceae bacterium]